MMLATVFSLVARRSWLGYSSLHNLHSMRASMSTFDGGGGGRTAHAAGRSRVYPFTPFCLHAPHALPVVDPGFTHRSFKGRSVLSGRGWPLRLGKSDV